MKKSKDLREKSKKQLLRKCVLSNMQVEGFLRPKIHTKKTKYESLIEDQVRKTLISKGDSYFEV